MGLACVNPPCINGKIDPWKKNLHVRLADSEMRHYQLLCANVKSGAHASLPFDVSLKCSEEDLWNVFIFLMLLSNIFHSLANLVQVPVTIL